MSSSAIQHLLPLNPAGFGPVSADSSFNTAVSFASNTNWQGYSGEVTMSYLTQMLGLTVQNFVSAATGMAVLALFIRGLVRHSTKFLGNFWVDMTRSVLYILLPLSVVLALALVSQGVIQNFSEYQTVSLLEPTTDAEGKTISSQVLPMGPAASQIAIKQLGTNGGGFFNVNSAHPFENPTPSSNFLEMLSILLIPVGLCFTFGRMVGDKRQGWAVFATMAIIFVMLLRIGRLGGTERESSLWSGYRPGSRRISGWWKHGGEGSPLRDCELCDLGNRDNRSFQRVSKFDA